MSFSAFETALGLTQGRIQPTGESPDDGDFVFVLGSDTEGRIENLSDGDDVFISQSLDVTGIDFIRIGLASFRTTADAGLAGLAWEVALFEGITELASMRGWPGQRSVADLVADVHALSGVRSFSIVLRLVTA